MIPSPSHASIYDEIPLALSESAPEWEKRAYWDDEGTAYIESAMRFAEVGRFNLFLLIVCLIAYSSTSTVPNILSKFSATIQCDYQLSLDDKKAINDVVYVCKRFLGMVLGGVGWSILADTLSRKWTLIVALLVYSISTVGLTLSSTFFWFGLFRGVCTFSLSGITCITVVFIAEFQVRLFRGMPICCLQLAYVVAMVTIPILPLTWKARVLIGAISPIFAVVGLMFFPDSPRFLLSRGREKAAIRSLHIIHDTNTGITRRNFPIRHLKDNKTVDELRYHSVVKPHIPRHLEPAFICIPIIMLTQFVLMFSYYTLWMWFPYMVARTEAFFPLIRVEDIPQDCKFGLYYKGAGVTRANTFSNVEFIQGDNNSIRVTSKSKSAPTSDNPCNNEYRRRRFNVRSSTMDALACMPSIIWLVVKIDTMGRKFFITISHVVAGCLAFASYYMHTAGAELLFSCLFDSVTLLSVAVSHCLAVELFPTRVRVLGVALVVGAGQLGAILADIGGAISFGLSCVVVVSLIAIALATAGILTMTIPETTGIPLR